MLDKYTCLEKLANQRSDEVVVTTMSVAMPWATHSDGTLDFAHVESAMGHAADFALGLAIAQPNRRVLCINGDGSTLMSLGVLVTLAQRPARNLTLIITENGTYEVTGSQPVPGADFVDFVPDQALDLLDRCGFCQVNIPLRLAAQMRVRVDKTRHNEPAVEVDRDWRDELRKELLAAHSDDFVVLDCNCRLN